VYHQKHGKDLETSLNSECSGDFLDLCLSLVRSPVRCKVALLKRATKGPGTRSRYLIDVLATASNREVREIFEAEPSIIQAIYNDVGGDFAKVINEVLKGKREEFMAINDNEAQMIAEQLYKAGEGRLGTSDTVFIEIISKRSPQFLDRVSHFYAMRHKHSLEQAIKSETSGHYQEMLVALTKTKYVYFADRFEHAVKGLGTDDGFLTYIFGILNRAEIRQVALIYQTRHKRSLLTAVRGDTSGHYRDLLTLLLAGC